MKKVEKIDYISFGLVVGVSNAIITLIVSILQLAILSQILNIFSPFVIDVFSLGVAMIIISPILGFVGGFIIGIIIAAIYNYFLNRYIKLKVE